jgi:hypothetical protein
MPKTMPVIDARWIAQTFAFKRQLTTPDPVTDAWLHPGQTYGSVLRDNTGQWRMWYLDDPVYTEHFATSRDGIKWETPNLNLGLVNNKSGATLPNAIMTSPQKDKNGRWLSGVQGPEGFCVLDNTITPHPASKARFTALYLARWVEESGKRETGLCIAFSEDGIHWEAAGDTPVLTGWMDTGNVFFYDPRIKKYVIYGRPNAFVDRVTHANRLVGRSESQDLLTWTPYRTVLDTDDLDADPMAFLDEAALRAGGNVTKAQQAAAWQAITEGATKAERALIRGRNRQWYGLTVFPYGDLYLGVGMMYDIPSGNMWLELLHSYDGIDWRREAARTPWVPFEQGRWDYPMQVPGGSPPVRVGDEDWFYYSATRKNHHGSSNEMGGGTGTKEPLRVIGACKVKRDRWAGYIAGAREAELLTQPLTQPFGPVTLNARVAQGGDLRVELCDGDGKVLPGFGLEDCQVITGDSLEHPVAWKGGTPAITGPWRLRIIGKSATLFAVSCGL